MYQRCQNLSLWRYPTPNKISSSIVKKKKLDKLGLLITHLKIACALRNAYI